MSTTKNTVVDLLTKHHIPFETWGQGATKTLDDLIKEVDEGETTFVEEQGRLIRIVSIATVDVYRFENDQLLFLREEKQVFANGSERVRTLEGSLYEKLKITETFEAAAERGLREELEIATKLQMRPIRQQAIKNEDTQSYPGLRSKKTIQAFEVFLPLQYFKPEGYVYKQKDKTTYFKWEPVPEPEEE